MAITNQALSEIQTSLQNISSGLSSLSGTEKTNFENSASANALKGGLTSLSGTLTSEQARRNVANAQKTEAVNTNSNIPDAYSKLFAENNKTKSDLAAAQAQLTSAQSGLSIADQQKKQAEDDAAAALLKGKKNNTDGTPVDPNSSVGLDSIAGKDPILKAMVDSANEQRNSITSQLDVLNRQTLDAGTDTKFMVAQIENLANQQIQRQQKTNEDVIRGAKVAGLSAGLAQYSPETHSGIVQNVINDGLALIQDIEFKAMQQKYQAKKDLRDFNYKSYLESSKLMTQYNDLKNQTIIKMYEQLQKEETNAREQIKFDNEQADRNAIILAPELVGSTPEQIAATAKANGIELGALMREVEKYKQEQEMYGLDKQSKLASLRGGGGTPKRSTQVITLDGKQVLVDTQTGELISEFGKESVDFNTYLQTAEEVQGQSINPDSKLYKELKSDWENSYGGNKSSTVVDLYGTDLADLISQGKSPSSAIRALTEGTAVNKDGIKLVKDPVKLTREEEQQLLDHLKK